MLFSYWAIQLTNGILEPFLFVYLWNQFRLFIFGTSFVCLPSEPVLFIYPWNQFCLFTFGTSFVCLPLEPVLFAYLRNQFWVITVEVERLESVDEYTNKLNHLQGCQVPGENNLYCAT